MSPRVSVVLPTFNAAAHLAEAMESLARQTFRDFEAIVVDGGSTDGTQAIVQDMARRDKRFRLVAPGREALVDSLNRGCNAANGEFIARMDADDVAHPERFERQVAFLQAHPDVGVVGSAIQCMDEAGRLTYRVTLPREPGAIRWAMNFDNPMAHATIMVRTRLMRGVPYRPEFAHCEDYDLWERLDHETRLANLPQPLLLRREWSGNVCSREPQAMRSLAQAISERRMARTLHAPTDSTVAAQLRAMLRGEAPTDTDAARSGLRLYLGLEAAARDVRPVRRSREVRRETALQRAAIAFACRKVAPAVATRVAVQAFARAPLAIWWLAGRRLNQRRQVLRTRGDGGS